MECVQDQSQVSVGRKSTSAKTLDLKLIDQAGDEILMCLALASDSLQCVHYSSAVWYPAIVTGVKCLTVNR